MAAKNNGKADDKVVSLPSIDDAKEQARDDIYEAPGRPGLVLQLSKVSRYVVDSINKKYPMPKVPVNYVEAVDREEENPLDPDYIEAYSEAAYQRGQLLMNTYMGLGTKVLKMPEGMVPYESEEWSQDLFELSGVEVAANGKTRYIEWLKYYALGGDDVSELALVCMRYSGLTTEVAVQEAVDSFRNNEERSTDQPALSEAAST